MTSRVWKAAGLLSLVLAMAGAAMAHHSFAVYDHTKTLTLSGTVTVTPGATLQAQYTTASALDSATVREKLRDAGAIL